MSPATSELRKLFKQRGFSDYEIALFFNDIFFYMNRYGCRSVLELNDELESLGWGIGVVDESTYNKIRTFIS